MNKIIGYVLLAAGLLLITLALWQSYNIFTGKTSAPIVFQTTGEINSQGAVGDAQQQINQAVQKQLNQILPPASITKILNLASWCIFAGILIFGGSALSGIGVKLIKSGN